MDKLTAIKVFLTVAETGSFTETADRLEISKPMITRYVALMEEWLNARLFQRTTRKVSLTDAGEQAVIFCQKFANLREEMEQDFAAQAGELRGTLRIACNNSFGSSHLALAVNEFLLAHPKLQVQFVLSDDTVNLVEERIDLAIRITNNPDPNAVARKLGSCHSLLVASPTYLARFGSPTHPEELEHHRYLSHSRVNRREWKFTQGEKEISLELTSQFTSNDTTALFNFTLAHGGIAMLPKYMVDEPLNTGLLKTVMPDWQLPVYNIYAMYPSRHKLPLSVRALLDFLVAKFSGQDW